MIIYYKRKNSKIKNSNTLNIRIYRLIHIWGANRNCISKLINRCGSTRHLLCNSTFSLCTKNRRCIYYVCWPEVLISFVHRSNFKHILSQSSFLHYVYRSKYDFFSTTLFRVSRNATPILWLPWLFKNMKPDFIIRINNQICRSVFIYQVNFRKPSHKTVTCFCGLY